MCAARDRVRVRRAGRVRGSTRPLSVGWLSAGLLVSGPVRLGWCLGGFGASDFRKIVLLRRGFGRTP